MLRLISLATTAIALLYAAEFIGVVPARQYFPSLPRLEASANTPQNWAGAAGWGLEHLSALSNFKLPTMATSAPEGGRFTDRVVAKRPQEGAS